MSLVVDSSVIVAALIDSGPAGAWSEAVIDGHVLYAPELVRVEATNVLRRLELAKEITTSDANGAQEDLTQLEIELFPFEPFAARVWELRHSLTSYDAWYVALAEDLGFSLATLDGRLTKASGPTCKFLTADAR